MATLLDSAYARLARGRLAYGQGTTNAWDEAVYLVLHALELPLDELMPVLEREISSDECDRALRLIDARVRRRVPAAYLTREAWLGDFRFYVDERVIVPRSYIAELLRNRLAPWIVTPQRIRRALDLCTGSGCLAILLARVFPQSRVDATDISRDALAVARRNVGAYRLKRRVRLFESDMFNRLPARQRYDLIVANPPYVDAKALRRLPHEFRHEPRLALAGGDDGLDAVRIILREVSTYLRGDGLLVVEVGHKRRRVEQAFPHLPFVWPDAGSDCVFMLSASELGRARVPRSTRPAAAPDVAARHPAKRTRVAPRRG